VKRVFVVRSKKSHFVKWLEDYTSSAYTDSPEANGWRIQDGWLRLHPEIPVYADSKITLSLHLTYVSEDRWESIVEEPGITFEVQSLTSNSIELTIHCDEPAIMAYCETLLAAVSERWDVKELTTLSGPPGLDESVDEHRSKHSKYYERNLKKLLSLVIDATDASKLETALESVGLSSNFSSLFQVAAEPNPVGEIKEQENPDSDLTKVYPETATQLLEGKSKPPTTHKQEDQTSEEIELIRLGMEATKYGVQVKTIKLWEELAEYFKKGLPHATICQLLDMPESTLRDNKKRMRSKGYWADHIKI
jgi:hypothetical protein